jgi:heme exporter protein C
MNQPASKFPPPGLAFWLLTAACFAAALARLLYWTPPDINQGPIQKIFYLHLPAAINTFAACLIVFIAGIGYLWQREDRWDDLAAAAAKVAVLLCSIVLFTGMFWAKRAWGHWWEWSPRLTFSLILWFLYVVYLMIRGSIESRQRRATISAVYAIIAFCDVPLVWLSARMLPDPYHPGKAELAPAMWITLFVWFIPVSLLCAGLIAERFAAHQRRHLSEPRPMGPTHMPHAVGGIS